MFCPNPAQPVKVRAYCRRLPTPQHPVPLSVKILRGIFSLRSVSLGVKFLFGL